MIWWTAVFKRDDQVKTVINKYIFSTWQAVKISRISLFYYVYLYDLIYMSQSYKSTTKKEYHLQSSILSYLAKSKCKFSIML